jgi:hypothetical protein
MAALAVYEWDFFRGEPRWKNHLEHFYVIAVAEFAMTNLGRLMDARPGLEANHTVTLVFELDPTLQHIDKLKGGLVQMGLTRELLSGRRADDMSLDASLRCFLDSEIAVLEERPQTSFELSILCVRRDESFGGHVGILAV